MMVKPMKTLELHYPMIQFLIIHIFDMSMVKKATSLFTHLKNITYKSKISCGATYD